MAFGLLFLLVFVYVIYKSSVEIYGSGYARRLWIRSMPIIILTYVLVLYWEKYKIVAIGVYKEFADQRSLDETIFLITTILTVGSILAFRYQRKPLGGLLLHIKTSNAMQTSKICLEILGFILLFSLVLGLLFGIYLITSNNLGDFSFGGSIKFDTASSYIRRGIIRDVASHVISIAVLVAAMYVLAKVRYSDPDMEVELREKGIWTRFWLIRWEQIKSYTWESTKPNVLTIHYKHKPSLFDMGYWSIAIPERHRNAVLDILAEHLPG
jgi:hypothetical protein